jgi:hypothetical protein
MQRGSGKRRQWSMARGDMPDYRAHSMFPALRRESALIAMLRA